MLTRSKSKAIIDGDPIDPIQHDEAVCAKVGWMSNLYPTGVA